MKRFASRRMGWRVLLWREYLGYEKSMEGVGVETRGWLRFCGGMLGEGGGNTYETGRVGVWRGEGLRSRRRCWWIGEGRPGSWELGELWMARMARTERAGGGGYWKGMLAIPAP